MKLVIGTIILIISGQAIAGTAKGKVTGYIPYSTGSQEIIFVQVQNHLDSPDCNVTTRFTMTSNNPKFKSTNSALLAAYISGTQITAKGLGTCNNFGNSEDLKYICMGDIPC